MNTDARSILERLKQQLEPDADRSGRLIAAEKTVREIRGLIVAVGGTTERVQQGSPPFTPHTYSITLGAQTVYVAAHNGTLSVGTTANHEKGHTEVSGLVFHEPTSSFVNGVDQVVDAVVTLMAPSNGWRGDQP